MLSLRTSCERLAGGSGDSSFVMAKRASRAGVNSFAPVRPAAEEMERERLELLAELHDPLTDRQLDWIGVAERKSCLDAGAEREGRVEQHDLLTDPLPLATLDLAPARCDIPLRLVV